MGEWSSCTIGDAVQQESVRVGNRHELEVFSSTKHHGLVPSRAYFKGRQIFSDDRSNYRVVEPEWFAYATNHLAEGSIGINDSGTSGCVSPMYTVFSATEDSCPNFLHKVFKSPDLMRKYALHEQASVDRRGSIRFGVFAAISLALPPLEEQRRIAEILDTIDETIQTTERVITKLELGYLGLQQRIFGWSTWRDNVKVVQLRDLLDSRPRNGKSPVESAVWQGSFVLGLGCLGKFGFRAAQLKLAPSLDRSLSSALLTDGDLLISRSNTLERVGYVGRYKDVGSPCIYPDLMMRLQVSRQASARFVELALQSGPGRREIQSLASGTSGSMVKITGAGVSQLRIPDVSRPQQEGIAEVFDRHGDVITRERRYLDRLRETRAGLASDLLSGRVRTMAS